MQRFYKLLALILTTVLLLTVISVPVSADVTYPFDERVNSFEFTENDIGKGGLNHQIWAWGQGNEVSTVSIVPDGDKYKLKVAFPNDIISGGLISVETKQYPEKARAVVFDIDCSELDTDKILSFKFQVNITASDYKGLAKGDIYYLKNSSGVIEQKTVNNTNSCLEIPGGFNGAVAVPLDNSGISDYAPEEITQLTLGFVQCSNSSTKKGLSGKTIYMNNFGYIAPEHPHVYGDWVIESEAKPGVAGSKHKVCTCGHVEYELIPALPEVRFKSASLSLYSNIAINYTVIADLSVYSDVYVLCQFDGKEYKLTDYYMSGTNLVFPFKEIAPNKLNQNVTSKICVKYGDKIFESAPVTYSVVQYAKNQLPKAKDEFATLLVDLMNYGTATQIYTDYKTDDLANAWLTKEQAALGTQADREYKSVPNMIYAKVDNPTAVWQSANLNLKDAITIGYTVQIADTAPKDGIYAKFECSGKVWTIPYSKFINTNGTRHKINMRDLNAAQLSETVYATICDKNGNAISDTLAYSVESYVARKLNDGDEKLVDLIKSMMRYGDAATDYVNRDGDNETAPDFVVAKELPNLIENGRFQTNADGWTLTGNAAFTTERSRRVTDSGALKIEGTGKAEYSVSNLSKGKYQVRAFAYDTALGNNAKITVMIDGVAAQTVNIVPRNWWLEYVTKPLEIAQGSNVTVIVELVDSGTIILDEVQLIKIPYEIPEPVSGKNPVSHLVKREDGTYYVEVNGNPLMFNAVHLYDEDKVYSLDEMAAKAKEAGYNCFIPAIAWGFFWRDVQPTLSSTPNFSKLDEILRVAEKYDMYVDLQWYGSGYGPATESAPDFIRNDHTLHSHKPDGTCDKHTHGVECCVADYTSQKLLEYEKDILEKFMAYITEKDVNRRIVGIEIECEAIEGIYKSHQVTAERFAAYVNELGKVVKESDHPMITHINLGYGMAPHFIFNTPYLDINGTDPYGAHAKVTANLVSNTFDSRVPHIMESCGFNNLSVHFANTIVQGGHLSMYPLANNSWNDSNGVYGKDFEWMPWTRRLISLNRAILKCSSVLVTKPLDVLQSFNADKNYASATYSETKSVGGYNLTMESKDGTDPVGIAFLHDGAIYCFADNEAYFAVNGTEVSAEYGYFTQDGIWVSEENLTLETQEDSSSRVAYTAERILKLSYTKK